MQEETHAKEMQDLKDFFALQLAAKDNEIAALKQLEQQNDKFAGAAYGQSCESEKYNHGCQQPLEEDILADEKRQILLRPEGMPDDAYEVGRDISTRYYFVRGYIRCQVITRLKYRDPRGNYYHVNLPEKYKNCMGRTEATESLIAYILSQHFEFGVTIADIELQMNYDRFWK